VKRSQGWIYEGLGFYATRIANGGCAAPLVPVHRFYNNRARFNDSNHRYVTDRPCFPRWKRRDGPWRASCSAPSLEPRHACGLCADARNRAARGCHARRGAAARLPVEAGEDRGPFAVGGIADTFARLIGQRVQEQTGQAVVVENKAGAGGTIGADAVAKSPPDGYTLVMGSIGSHAVNQSLMKAMPYDTLRDFAPIAFVLEADSLLVVNPEVKVANVKELVELADASRSPSARAEPAPRGTSRASSSTSSRR
jgi:hypothetical protein